MTESDPVAPNTRGSRWIPAAGFMLLILLFLVLKTIGAQRAAEQDHVYLYESAKLVRGPSGSAEIDATSMLVVHDAHAGNKEHPRLSVLRIDASGNHSASVLTVDPKAWRNNDPDHVASDLESACRLDGLDNEFLVAESGRTDLLSTDKAFTRNEHLGRLFHIKADIAGGTATVLKTPELKLAAVSTPQFTEEQLNSTKREAAHSVENYEGLACVRLERKENGSQNFLVLLGERGGRADNDTSSLHWGVYDLGQPESTRSIAWKPDTDTQVIVAPGKSGNRTDAQWRDITGLHVDKSGVIYATAAFDTDESTPPYEGVAYVLGVVCIDPSSDRHRYTRLCDYSLAPYPTVFEHKPVIAKSTHYKFESVSAPLGSPRPAAQISVLSEDEDLGGKIWPSIP